MPGMARIIVVFAALAVNAGCSDPISGTYADESSATTYEFHDDGRVTILVLGTTVAADYTQDGDRVIVTSAQGTVVLRRADDRLYGPMGLELNRRPD